MSHVRARRRTARRSTIVALVVGLALGAATTAWPQDVAQAPPGMADHLDAKGYTKVQLPRGTTEVGPDSKDEYSLQRFGINWSEKGGDPWFYIYVKQVPAYARANLCGYQRGWQRWGDLVETSPEYGEGEYWELRRKEAEAYYRYRVIEHAGQCFEIICQARTRVHEDLGGLIKLMLASFEGAGPPAEPEPPADFKVKEEFGCRVWTNAKKGRDNQRILKLHQKAWETMAAGLPGDLIDTAAPRVIICQDDESYRKVWNSKKGLPAYCFIASNLRALVVRLSMRRDKEFEQALQRAACAQYVRAFFGGPTPAWIEDGMRIYGVQGVVANGNFDQPFNKPIEKAREAAERRNARLDDLFAFGVADTVDRDSRDHELYAWHWFFRHGPGKEKYGDLYDRHLATLRESGNVAEARKVWEPANMDDMRDEFLAWIAKWRK